MEDKDITVKISNFKLNIFRNLLAQSLIVEKQLMIEFNSEILNPSLFSNTKSFMKLWTCPIQNLIASVETDDLKLNTEPKEKLSFPTFNFYVLKGELFQKYLSVHNTDTVDLEFILHHDNGKYKAANMTIFGKSENLSPLVTNFTLTTEELISNVIEDYADILKECTPTKDMFEFSLTNSQMQDVKRLIKNLHKSSSDNTAFLTFTIDVEKQKVVINDKVFKIEFEILKENKENFPKENMSFNILKSDFIITGNHSFTIYTNDDEEKVILGAHFANAIIWCLLAKVTNNSMNFDESIMSANMEANIDALDLEEYLH